MKRYFYQLFIQIKNLIISTISNKKNKCASLLRISPLLNFGNDKKNQLLSRYLPDMNYNEVPDRSFFDSAIIFNTNL